MERRRDKWLEQPLVLALAFLFCAFSLVQSTDVDGEGKGGPAEPGTGMSVPPLPPGWTDGSWQYSWGWAAGPDRKGGGYGFGYGGSDGERGGGGGSDRAFGFGVGGYDGLFGDSGAAGSGSGDIGGYGEPFNGDDAGYLGFSGGGFWSKRGLFRGN